MSTTPLTRKVRKKETQPRKTRKTTKEFIEKANLLHDFQYDYTKTVYIKSNINVIVTCRIHGDFLVLPNNHIRTHKNKNWNPVGCPVCGKIKTIKRNKLNILSHEEFLDRVNHIHDFKYDYPEEYKGDREKISIICPSHGSFKQLASNHRRGSGCPKCKNSRGSKRVAKILKERNIKYTMEYTFNDCVGDKLPLKFDFMLDDYNILIEYDGEQHFKPVKFNPKMTDVQAHLVYAKAKRYDNIKNEYCLKHNIPLIRIPYWYTPSDIVGIIEKIK